MTDMCKIERKVSDNIFGRLFFSHELLAFFYGLFLVAYEMVIVADAVAWMHEILILWAGLIFLYDLFVRKIWKKIPFLPLLIAFACCVCITAVLNIKTGLVMNIKATVLTILPLVAFLPTCFVHDDSESRKKSFIVALLGAEIVMFVAVIIALYMYLLRLHIPIPYNGGTRYLGIAYYFPNDPTSSILLYGLFRDTNHAAGFALFSVAYSIILLNFTLNNGFKYKWMNISSQIFAVLNMIVQLCYFPLANSRGGWLCLLIVVCFLGFMVFFVKSRNSVKFRGLIAVVVGVLFAVVVYLGLYVVRTGMTKLSYFVSENYYERSIKEDAPVVEDEPDCELVKETNVNAEIVNADIQVTVPEVASQEETVVISDDQLKNSDDSEKVRVSEFLKENAITTEDDQFKKINDNFGAGRLGIWRDTFKLFTHKPLFGINSGNSGHYARIYIPDSILAQDKAIHNSYLDLLLDYGIAGTVALLVYFGACAWYVFKYMFKGQIEIDVFSLSLLGGVIVNAGISFLLSCNFINTTAMYFFLLMFVSCILSFMPSHHYE